MAAPGAVASRPSAPRLAGLVLAAGAGRRFGGPKGLMRGADGVPWVEARADALRRGGCERVLVVVGAAAQEVTALVPDGVGVVRAERWREGLSASLAAGIAALERTEHRTGAPWDAAVVALVDTPDLTAAEVSRVAATAGPGVLARAVHDGRPGHPVVLGREHWAAAAGAEGDSGARDLLRGGATLLVECGDLGTGRDVDVAAGTYRGGVTSTPPAPVGDASSDPTPGTSPATSRDTSRVDPPARRLVRAEVTAERLDVAEHAAAVDAPAAGAVVTFGGVVRDHDRGRRVCRLEYSAHPSAGRVVQEVAREVLAAHPVDALAVSHRTGPLEVGEVAFAVAVSAAHRREAFAAAEEVVEEVKRRLPVWKHQLLADGGDEWVGCP